MNWKWRRYKLWVINTETQVNLYLWNNWKQLMPSLDILLNLTAEPAFIRSFRSYDTENKWLGFGRMLWNEKNNIKWTTKYRDNNPEHKTIQFANTQIWAPDWNKCFDEGMPPEIFVNLYNYGFKNIKEGLIIAMPKARYLKNKDLVETVILKLAGKIPNSIISMDTLYWYPCFKIRNRIEDFSPQELYKIIERRSECRTL